jgi:Tol biopolymer transport system component
MGATGESVKRVTDAGFNPSWSPDGEFLVYSTLGIYDPSRDPRWGELRVAQVATGEVRAIEIVGDAVQPSWSPHGSRIAFWSHSLSESNHRDVWTVPAGGGEIVPVTSDEHVDWNPVWSPDGEFLYFSSNRGGSSSLWRISIDEKTGVTKGAPLLVTTSDAARIQQITIARDGRRIAYQSDLVNSNLYKIAFDPESESVAGEPVAIVTGSRSVVHPDASPDGRSVAFSFFMNGGQADLAVVASDGTGLRQLTEEPHFSNFQPRWSRDGSEIVFVSSRSGNNELWSIRPDGGNLRHLTQTRSRVMNPVWSPDGRRVSYWMGENYYFLDPALSWNQQTPEKLPEPPEGRFEATDWSPDGNRLVGYVTYPSRKSRIAVFSIDSQEYEILPIEGGSPYWLSDGRRLIFNVGEALVLLDVTTDRRKEILKREGLNADDGSLSISPDDRTIYFLIDRWEADIWMVQMEDSSLP